jgi:hypothetical protein
MERINEFGSRRWVANSLDDENRRVFKLGRSGRDVATVMGWIVPG